MALSEQQLEAGPPFPALPMTARLRVVLAAHRRLPPATREALLVAAAEEAGELTVMLRAAAELELPQDALDPAEETGLVRTDGAILSFRHPLVRSVVTGRRRSVSASGPMPRWPRRWRARKAPSAPCGTGRWRR